ncbi:MAG: ABC transporter ATP-binding protein [Alphaproteobacteria bacterium]|nr:ABC transporter ATP-binding protein [Alphaproteobacteria bacterium]
MSAPLLSVRDLTVQFRTDAGWLTAVEQVGFELGAQETLGIVGESGSGKSVTALSILGLHAASTTRIPTGAIAYAGQDLLKLPDRAMRRIRGGEIAMIFQDPMSSLNPVLTVADQISETLMLHQGLDRKTARNRAIGLLDMVRIADAAHRVDAYPHQLSGGMRQRVMIAIAIACRPKLLIADEPTTALDVTIQAQILDLLRELQTELGMSVILISHDLGVIAEFARRVLVMYAGRVVEAAPSRALFRQPMHPYTSGLLAAIPPLNHDVTRLSTIPGSIPDPGRRIPGCRFSPRCTEAQTECREQAPDLVSVGDDHFARCPPRLHRMRPV